jgi:hypothetical protein
VALRESEQAARPAAWWHQFYAADATIGEAVARLDGGDSAGARDALGLAEALYASCGDALPPPIRSRRLRVIARLRARVTAPDRGPR